MNKKFMSELAKLEDYEFFTLEHHFWIARMVRNVMSKNAIDNKRMSEVLGVSVRKMKSIINGAYEFDLIFLAKLQSFNQQLASNAAKIKVEAESIGFSTYKDQYPLYVARIEKLIDILEKQNQPK